MPATSKKTDLLRALRSPLALCLLLFICSFARAQQVTVTLDLEGEAKDFSGTPYWVIDPLRTAQNGVRVDDSAVDPALKASCANLKEVVRAHFVSVLQSMATAGGGGDQTNPGPPWLLMRSDGSLPDTLLEHDFFGYLLSKYTDLAPLTPPGYADPSAAGETLKASGFGTWQVQYTPQVIGALKILVQTHEAAAGGPTKIHSLSVKDLASHLAIKGLAPEEASIPVTITYAAEDLRDLNGQPLDESEIKLELEKVAREALLAAREVQLRACTVVDQPTLNAVQGLISGAYFVAPAAGVAPDDSAPATWVIAVTEVQFVEKVGIEVENRKTARDAAIEEALNRRYLSRLEAQPNRVVTRSAVQKDVDRLDAARAVQEVNPVPNGLTLTYSVKRRPEVVNLLLKGAGSYSPEYLLNGEVELTAENWLHRDDSTSLDLTGSSEVQRGEFQFSLPGPTPHQHRNLPADLFRGLSVDLRYRRDLDQLLGNEVGSKLRDREAGGEAKLSFGYDSFRPRDYLLQTEGLVKGRKRTRQDIGVDLGFEYWDENIKPRDPAALQLTNGRIAVPSLGMTYFLGRDLRQGAKGPGLGEFDLLFTASGQKGTKLLGGDFDYRQYSLSLSGQLFFGFSSPTDLFLRYQRGAGASSSGTPLFRFFRLGGPLNVRGLEEGEYIGRSMAYDRSEAGVGVLPLWRFVRGLFPPKKEAGGSNEDGDAGNPSPSLGGVDLSNAYIKLFFDRGRTFDTSSLNRILNPAGGVQGFGIAAELRGMSFKSKRANLTLGYAHSPDSKLHRSGVVVTGLSIDF
jgi:hypothetical protein